MDGADLKTIHDFTDVSFVVESSASAAEYLARASAMLAGNRLKINTDDIGNVPYRKALNAVRKAVQSTFLNNEKRVEFFDMSEKQPVKEALRIDMTLAKSASAMVERAQIEGPYSIDTKDTFGQPLCVVVGPQPSMTAKDFFARGSGIGINAAGVDDETTQRIAMWHELGHCLLGNSDNKADIFAALMEIRSGKNSKVIPLLAAFNEFEEMTNPLKADDRVVSPMLWSLTKIEDKLRNSTKFKEMSLKEVASLASEIVTDYSPGKDQKAHIRQFRQALNGIVGMRAHYVQVSDGLRAVNVEQWIEARAREIPEFKRLLSVVANLKQGAPLPVYESVDIDKFTDAIVRLAKAGDPTAIAYQAFYQGTEYPQMASSASLAERVGMRQIEPIGVGDIKFDPARERISFSFDNDLWEIRNSQTGDLVKTGSVSFDSRWQFPSASASNETKSNSSKPATVTEIAALAPRR